MPPEVPGGLPVAAVFGEGLRVYLILNAYWELLEFELPPGDDGGASSWRRRIDTALDSPHDIVPWQTAAPLSNRTYQAAARSVVVLFEQQGR
jgi:isoamylase